MAYELRACSVPGCNLFANGDTMKGAGNLCSRHYQRMRAHGHPTGGRVAPGTLLKWLKSAIEVETDDCIEWPFGKHDFGYGRLKVDGRSMGAHALACLWKHGPAPEGKPHAAHRCGYPACVNPRHIRWETPTGNMQDKKAHGTNRAGSQNPMAKLNEASVIWMRENKNTHTISQMARMFGVSFMVASNAVKKKTWRSI